MANEQSTPRVAHQFGDYRIVTVWKKDPNRPNDPATQHAIFEHRAGFDAMGGETWWEMVDVCVSAVSQSVHVDANEHEAADAIVALVQAFAKLAPETT